MRDPWQLVHTAIEANAYVIGLHAAVRLRQRRIPLWQVVVGTLDGEVLVRRPRAKPNPTVELQITLPDGTSAKAVWAWLAQDASAKLVTVHFIG